MAAQHYFRFMNSHPLTYHLHGDNACKSETLVPAVLLLLFTLSGCASSGNSENTSVATPDTTTTSTTTSSGIVTPDESPATSQESPSELQTTANLESGLTRFGALQTTAITEASGMAFSGQQPNLLWLINDSGNDASLFAVTTRGNSVASYRLDVDNRDWEDLAQFNVNGESFLLIADIGDNLRNQSSYRLHLLPEPLPDTRNSSVEEPILQPLITFELMYEDGAHNAEAAAIADDGMLYIITKDDVPMVYAAPIREALDSATANSAIGGSRQTIPLLATRIGSFRQPSLSAADSLVNLVTGVSLNAITALDVDNNLGEAWFITYRGIYRLPAASSGGWPDVLLASPVKLANHDLNQAEAMAVSPNNEGVFVTSEGRGSPLLRLIP